MNANLYPQNLFGRGGGAEGGGESAKGKGSIGQE